MINEMTLDEFISQTKDVKIQSNCPVMYAMNMLSGKWEIKIIFYLIKYGTVRFGEFKKYLPEITNTMLTCTLKKFEKADIVIRKQYNEIPPHVEYSLTDAGYALGNVIFELAKWGEKYQVDKFIPNE